MQILLSNETLEKETLCINESNWLPINSLLMNYIWTFYISLFNFPNRLVNTTSLIFGNTESYFILIKNKRWFIASPSSKLVEQQYANLYCLGAISTCMSRSPASPYSPNCSSWVLFWVHFKHYHKFYNGIKLPVTISTVLLSKLFIWIYFYRCMNTCILFMNRKRTKNVLWFISAIIESIYICSCIYM